MSVTTKQSIQKHSMRKRHVPMRRCVLCRNSKAQSELIRFYKTDIGNWELDTHHLTKLSLHTGKAVKPSGRGAWVCLNACLNNSCHNPKKLAYFFKKQATEIETLLQELVTKHESTGTEREESQSGLSKETQFHSGGMNV